MISSSVGMLYEASNNFIRLGCLETMEAKSIIIKANSELVFSLWRDIASSNMIIFLRNSLRLQYCDSYGLLRCCYRLLRESSSLEPFTYLTIQSVHLEAKGVGRSYCSPWNK